MLGCESLDKISVAVIGATGAVGQRFVQLLEGHPWFDINIVAASDRSAGNKYQKAVKWGLVEKLPDYAQDKKIEPIDSKIFKKEGIELIFSALPSDIAKKIEDSLTFPGQIKVTVIRETRAVQYANK